MRAQHAPVQGHSDAAQQQTHRDARLARVEVECCSWFPNLSLCLERDSSPRNAKTLRQKQTTASGFEKELSEFYARS